FLVSLNFLSYSIDNWFNLRIGDAMNNTLEVAQIYYARTADYAKFYARQISGDITRQRLYRLDRAPYLRALGQQRQRSYNIGLLEIQFDSRREKMVFRDPRYPEVGSLTLSPNIVEEVFAGKEVSTVQSSSMGELICGLAPVFSDVSPEEVIGIVAVSYYMPGPLVEKMTAIAKTADEYRQLALLKNPIKYSYMITLFIVTLLIIFSATWFGIFMAKGITVPIQDLADATRKIAQGDLDHQINIKAEDEIGILVDSFNAMTKELKKSKESLELANLDLERRRVYMETVLRDVSAGVISVDKDGVITTINRAAQRMMDIKVEKVLNQRYEAVLGPEHLAVVNEFLQHLKESEEGFIEKQIDIHLKGRSLTVLVTATELRDENGDYMGIVLVFEDMTQLQKAERAAAWREVARRMAHEIKNPLTPIQLSAQRLQRRYGETLGEEGAVFQECTQTIINQVEVLKNLVNAFSRYARMPVTTPSLNDLNAVIAEAVSLFQDAHKDIVFEFRRAEELPLMNIDPEQIKRVMVNLLDNAVAALTTPDGVIEIRTSYDAVRHRAIVEVADNGCGVPSSYKVKIFEPYFSTKGSGSGLGLAIVTSIIGDHNGQVSVRDNSPRGTVVKFELPAPEGEFKKGTYA
ncbi:MAG: ATP-binding protein, partial [Syntrophales bacterium]|nr:ATP-binding protein [Syntrophales bacterium]